jgi:hypothetical protein
MRKHDYSFFDYGFHWKCTNCNYNDTNGIYRHNNTASGDDRLNWLCPDCYNELFGEGIPWEDKHEQSPKEYVSVKEHFLKQEEPKEVKWKVYNADSMTCLYSGEYDNVRDFVNRCMSKDTALIVVPESLKESYPDKTSYLNKCLKLEYKGVEL